MPDHDPSSIPLPASNASGGLNMSGGQLDVGGDLHVGNRYSTTVITEEHAYDVRGLPNPYLGLSAFTYAEREKYAGREKLIAEWAAKITAPASPIPLLFITGASGSGKSSFAQAGLIPALEKYYDGFAVKHAVMRPAGDPFAALEDAVGRQLRMVKTPRVLCDGYVAKNPWGLLEDTPPSQINLLVIDQFEEFFTQSPQSAREQFFAWLAELPPFAKTRTHILATMRADYLPELFNHSALYEIAKRGVDLRAMNEEELKQAIQQPLRAAPEYGATKRFEPALVDKLAEDAAQNAAYLPLLQVTLEEIWRKGFLKHEAYTNLTDALKQRADQVLAYRDFDDAVPDEERGEVEEKALMNILLDLVDVSPGEDVRRDVRRQRTKLELTKGDPQRERWVQQLSAARLLSVQQESKSANQGFSTSASSVGTSNQPLSTSVDLIHETLLTNWTRLQKAIDERRTELHRRARFEQNLDEWLAQNRSDDYLLDGVRLAEARELETLDDVALRNEDAKTYLRASVARAEAEQQAELERERQRAEALEKSAAAEKQRGRILRIAIAVVSLLGLLAVGAAIFAFQQQSAAIASATEARARLLVAQGDQVFEEDPLLGMRLGLEGLALASNSDTDIQNSVLGEVSNLMKQGRAVRLGSRADRFHFHPESPTLIVAHADAPGEVRRWSDGSLLTKLAGDVYQVFFSPDEAASAFVVDYADAAGEVRRTSDGSLLTTLAGDVYQVFFSPDEAASTFVVDYADAPSEVRRTSDGGLLTTLPEIVSGVSSSPDAAASAFVVDYADAPSEVRRWSDGSRLATLAGDVSRVYFSPDAAASTFVVDYDDAPGEVRRWSDGSLLMTLAGNVWYVAFSPDAAASTFVVNYIDAPDEVLRTSDGGLLTTLPGDVAVVFFSPDAAASTFVVDYADAPSEVRRTSDGGLLTTLPEIVSGVFFSPDAAASTFVVGYADAPDEVRRTRDGRLLTTLAGKVSGVYFSPDAAASTFVVGYADAPDEVRRTRDGRLLTTLAGKVSGVYFSPDAAASTFVVGYADAPDEVRRTSDGGLLTTLPELVSGVYFSPDAAASTFVVKYADAPGEVRRWSDGRLLTTLAGDVADFGVSFSSDAAASTFMVWYDDAPSEVRRTSDRKVLGELGLSTDESIFDSQAQHLAVRYTDGRAYLVDLDFLREYGGPGAQHSAEELTALGCKYLFGRYEFDEGELKEYLEGEESRVCR